MPSRNSLSQLAVLDPGDPLGKEDFWNAKQLTILQSNHTTDDMLELLGRETLKKINGQQKNILAPLT